MKKVIFSAVMLLAVLGCKGEFENPDNKAVKVKQVQEQSQELTKAQLDAYLQLKGIKDRQGNQRDRALQAFIERYAMAETIKNQPVLDADVIKVELIEKRNDILLKAYFDSYLDNKVDEGAIDTFYQTNADHYKNRKVKLAHILFRIRPSAADEEIKKLQKEAAQVHQEIADGLAFIDAVAKYSQDLATAKKQGEMDWIESKHGDAALLAATIQMQVGDVSEPVHTKRGIHILKLLEEPQETPIPLEKVRDKIRYGLRQQAMVEEQARLRKEASNLIARLSAKGGITIQ